MVIQSYYFIDSVVLEGEQNMYTGILVELPKGDYKRIFERYKNCNHFFPLIGAVIEQKQNGCILVDNVKSPNGCLVVSSFGFAQFINMSASKDITDLFFQIFENKSLWRYKNISKLRLYCLPKQWKDKLKSNSSSVVMVERNRFYYSGIISESSQIITRISYENFDVVNDSLQLDLDSRFWNSKNDFINSANGFIIVRNNKTVCICYAAAISNNFSEVDIFTDEQHRNQGYAKMVAQQFITSSMENKIIPCWDCYSNNTASYELALALGFELKFTYNMAIVD